MYIEITNLTAFNRDKKVHREKYELGFAIWMSKTEAQGLRDNYNKGKASVEVLENAIKQAVKNWVDTDVEEPDE